MKGLSQARRKLPNRERAQSKGRGRKGGAEGGGGGEEGTEARGERRKSRGNWFLKEARVMQQKEGKERLV